jgi:hypothetical protein
VLGNLDQCHISELWGLAGKGVSKLGPGIEAEPARVLGTRDTQHAGSRLGCFCLSLSLSLTHYWSLN